MLTIYDKNQLFLIHLYLDNNFILRKISINLGENPILELTD